MATPFNFLALILGQLISLCRCGRSHNWK